MGCSQDETAADWPIRIRVFLPVAFLISYMRQISRKFFQADKPTLGRLRLDWARIRLPKHNWGSSYGERLER